MEKGHVHCSSHSHKCLPVIDANVSVLYLFNEVYTNSSSPQLWLIIHKWRKAAEYSILIWWFVAAVFTVPVYSGRDSLSSFLFSGFAKLLDGFNVVNASRSGFWLSTLLQKGRTWFGRNLRLKIAFLFRMCALGGTNLFFGKSVSFLLVGVRVLRLAIYAIIGP